MIWFLWWFGFFSKIDIFWLIDVVLKVICCFDSKDWSVVSCFDLLVFGICLGIFVLGVLGCWLYLNENDCVYLIFFISIIVCLKFLLVLLGKLIMKLEDNVILGLVVWICLMMFI